MSAHKGTRAHDGWEACPHLGEDGDGNAAACGSLSQYGCDRVPGKGMEGQEGTWLRQPKGGRFFLSSPATEELSKVAWNSDKPVELDE